MMQSTGPDHELIKKYQDKISEVARLRYRLETISELLDEAGTYEYANAANIAVAMAKDALKPYENIATEVDVL